ncbi:MAG: hypothetical protein LBB66_08715 [Desulfovibrio sp.]|jgi:tripartite-type tricarboxylate transporter receptor subunit TctC|nr:hypothetical protein [Desulfovibrio sp.]
MRNPGLFLLFICIFLTHSQPVNAAKYPSRPVTVVVAFSAGGGADMVARNFARYFEKYLGQPVVVTNKDGGGGTIGTSAVVHARPDGYTLLQNVVGPTVIQPLYGGTDYNKDSLRPVANLTNVSTLIALNKMM